MRTMYDSDNIDAIPDSAEIVAFYCDGEPGTATAQQLARFAGKVLVPITRKTGVRAKVADIEPGCIWPPSEARSHFEQGLSDTAYFGESNRGEVEQALQGLTFHRWVAAYPGNGDQLLDSNDVAHQYANSDTSGGHYDLSVVSDQWPTVAASTTQEGAVSNVPAQDSSDQPIEDAKGVEKLQAPIVDAVSVPGGRYLVAADGGVFGFGDAPYFGSIPDLIKEGKITELHAAICSIVAVDNRGYTLIAEDGGEFVFGQGTTYGPL